MAGSMRGKVIDISVGISTDTPVYPGDPIPEIERIASIEKDGFAVSSISFGSHTGTHIDAPSHAIKDGRTIDQVPLDNLVGRAVVLDLAAKDEAISGNDLNAAYKRFGNGACSNILLVRTRDSREGKYTSFSTLSNRKGYLDESAAEWIMDNGFNVVGIDSQSVDAQSRMTVHRLLLENGVLIVECLDMHVVEEGVYFFACMPLKIVGCDGSPTRAILI
ncbi:MAG: cyclase family protein, partial [Methanosarcinaceae archaeon]|nr:cyclase family protein [Methanosarcinaceae archaeon]